MEVVHNYRDYAPAQSQITYIGILEINVNGFFRHNFLVIYNPALFVRAAK